MYLTYDEYAAMGGSVDEASFPRLEMKARAMIDKMTFGRISAEEPAREAVKYACFELISAMGGEEALTGVAGAAVSSVSNDGVSITYADKGAADSRRRLGEIVQTWLAGECTQCGTPLLYRGVGIG